MTAINKYLILAFYLFGVNVLAMAQLNFIPPIHPGTQTCKPPLGRELFHDYVNTQQKNILKSDGKNDNKYVVSADEEINFLLTQTATSRIDALQCRIETDSVLNDQAKKKYLRGFEYLLRFFVANTTAKRVSPLILPDIITAYEKCFLNDKKGLSIEAIIKNL